MPKIIVKVGYMKPNQSKRSGFIEYIAKRVSFPKGIQNFLINIKKEKQNLFLITYKFKVLEI